MMDKLYNPVLMKEMKLRFRSFKSFSGLLFYLAVLCIFITGFVMVATEFKGYGYIEPTMSYALFVLLSIVQMALVMFITPGVTAGAISSEREKQTLNILLTTTQSSAQLIIGKLLSSIAFIVLMLIAGLPIYSLVFLFGGVSPSQMLTTFAFYFVTLVTIGSIGIFFSTITKKTIVAMIATYGAMIFLGAITAFLFFVSMVMAGSGVASTLGGYLAYAFASINPGALILTLTTPELKLVFEEMTGVHFPVWLTYLLFYSAVTVLCLTGAIKKLRANMKTQR